MTFPVGTVGIGGTAMPATTRVRAIEIATDIGVIGTETVTEAGTAGTVVDTSRTGTWRLPGSRQEDISS